MHLVIPELVACTLILLETGKTYKPNKTRAQGRKTPYLGVLNGFPYDRTQGFP